MFVYRHVFDKHIGDDELNAVRAIYKRRLPVVLTARKVHPLFDKLSGIYRLMAMLIYGCGLRLSECLSLRIKDVDIEQGILIVRAGKGDKDRCRIFSLLQGVLSSIGLKALPFGLKSSGVLPVSSLVSKKCLQSKKFKNNILLIFKGSMV